jgi:hypothetical protein
MVLILLLVEFDKKIWGARVRFLAVLLVFLMGVLEFRVFFDGNLLVDSW